MIVDNTSGSPGSGSVSERYVAAVNTADLDGLLPLFSDHAVLQHPLGIFTGAEEIAGFYRDVVFAGQAFTEIVTTAREGHREWGEIEATSPLTKTGGKVHAADLFELDEDGLITRLAIYYR